MAKRYASPLLAFMAFCIYTSDSFAGDLKDESTLIKNSTNSDTIYSNSDDASQGKNHPSNEYQMVDFHATWVSKLNEKRKEDITLTKEIMSECYLKTVEEFPETFRKKTYKIHSLIFYTPHGLTPTKVPGEHIFTPIKAENIQKMWNGNAPVYAGNAKIQIHHVGQNDEGEAIPLPKVLHRKKGTGDPLHFDRGPSKVTRSGKGGFESSKEIYYRSLAVEILEQIKSQYPEDFPELEKTLLGEYYNAWKKYEKKELNKKEIKDKENNPPIVATKKKNGNYHDDPTETKKQKIS